MTEPTNNTPIDLDVIEDGTEVTITVTTELYRRLQNMIFNHFPFKDMTHFSEIIAQINKGEYKDPLCEPLHTIIWLCNLYEDGAKQQGKISKKKWDTVNKKVIEP